MSNKIIISTENLKITIDDKVKSTEYSSYFDKDSEIDLTTSEGIDKHVNRNKNQFHKAPHDLETMRKFVKNGWFIEEGFSPCHNIPFDMNNERTRRLFTKKTVKMFLNGELHEMNDFSKLGNISFRGSPNSFFEGCQFVYNFFSGKLVVDNINKGTWDFGKYGTLAHLSLDVKPWYSMGNGEAVETEKDFLLSKNDETKFLNSKFSIDKRQSLKKIILEDGTSFIYNGAM